MNVLSNFKQINLLRFTVIALALLVSFSPAEARSINSGTVTKVTKKTSSKVIGSIYCVRGQVAVKGWERDLVRRNPGLNQFHWSPITAARPGVVVFRQSGTTSTLKQYHYAKPAVIRLSEVRAAPEIKNVRAMNAQATKFSNSQADLNGQLRAANPEVQAQMVSSYSQIGQPNVYTYQSRYQSKVNGRLISTR